MAKIKIFIVEDEALYAENLKVLIEQMGYWHVGTADNAEDAEEMIGAVNPDLLLLDINIKGDRDGISIAEKVDIPIIFISSQDDDATYSRLKTTMPIAFVNKPVNQRKLQRTIELAVSRLQSDHEPNNSGWEKDLVVKDYFFVKVRNKLEKVQISDISFVEVEDRYCTLYTSADKFLVRISLGELEKKLPTETFVRTHRAYIVNISRISSIDLGDSQLFIGKKAISISNRYREDLLKRLQYL